MTPFSAGAKVRQTFLRTRRLTVDGTGNADGYGIALDTDGCLQETGNGGVTWARATERGLFVAMFAIDARRGWLIGADGVYRVKD